jgi:hypothetical protein
MRMLAMFMSLLGYVVLLCSWNEFYVCVLHKQCYCFVCLNDKIGPHIFVFRIFMYLLIFYFLVAVGSYDVTNFNEN